MSIATNVNCDSQSGLDTKSTHHDLKVIVAYNQAFDAQSPLIHAIVPHGQQWSVLTEGLSTHALLVNPE
eukprot:1152762-Pelagomonas_calceolata.AAC.1